MKLAIIYSDKRGSYLAAGFRNFCEVVEVDLSEVTFTPLQKILSAALSFHFKRSDWVNDFHRNPLAVFFRRKNGNRIISRTAAKVDAVLQFGVMNTYDYSQLDTESVFYYLDGAYDKNSSLWTIKRCSKWFPSMQKQAFDLASGIFTFSRWAKNQIVTEYVQDEKKVFAVGWGACLPVKNVPLESKRKVTRLLFIGKPGVWKGLHILLAAFQKIQKKYPDIVLDVVGVEDGEVSEFNGDGLFFHGRQSAEDVICFLQQSELFILPSLYERASHATIEAMWYGCPVIVPNTCGAPEPVLAGNCGIIFEPGNADDLEKAILSLLEIPAERFLQLSENASCEASKNWSWYSVCERMVGHINTLTGNCDMMR